MRLITLVMSAIAVARNKSKKKLNGFLQNLIFATGIKNL